MDEGLIIALSPVQLAAVISDKSVTEGETLSNRLWGSLEFILGALEMAGAAALCAAPEPTGLTKAGCVVIGAHSMDTVKTAADKVITGLNTRSMTHRAAESLAKKFGAGADTAFKIGLAVDVAVPLGFAVTIGAARIASIRSGRISLILHESSMGIKPGGHTIAKHVGKSPEELLKRLEMEKRIPYATTFKDMQTAEECISKALSYNKNVIKSVVSSSKSGVLLQIRYPAGKVVGYGFKRGSTQRLEFRNIKVVISVERYNGNPYYILTAFPE